MAKQRKSLQIRRYSVYECEAPEQLLQEELSDGWALTAVSSGELRFVRTPEKSGAYVVLPNLKAPAAPRGNTAPAINRTPLLSLFTVDKWMLKAGADHARFSGRRHTVFFFRRPDAYQLLVLRHYRTWALLQKISDAFILAGMCSVILAGVTLLLLILTLIFGSAGTFFLTLLLCALPCAALAYGIYRAVPVRARLRAEYRQLSRQMRGQADSRAENRLRRLMLLKQALDLPDANEYTVLTTYAAPEGKHPDTFREAMLRAGIPLTETPVSRVPFPMLTILDYSMQLDGILVPSGAHTIPAARVRQSLDLFFRSKRAAFELLYRD